jgi:hypothetical protein
MLVTPIENVIPEENIIVFSPHYDDVLFMLGGYIEKLKKKNLLPGKKFHVIILFSRSNYLARTGPGNFDTSLDRLKLATGKRLLEDQNCLDELLGKFNYTYELAGELECFARGKSFAPGDMEFPHGMFEDFTAQDKEIFERMKDRIQKFSQLHNTALIFPTAFKEHVDHFITREAAIEVAREPAAAKFYFQEDKPYGGIATQEELKRTEDFIRKHHLVAKVYEADPESVITLAFKHYVSQVEEIYNTGIRERANFLQKKFGTSKPCDQLYLHNPG